jgi:hydrogenase/urease accessory protein HupE
MTPASRPLIARAAVAGLVAVACSVAPLSAHLVNTGMGPVYDGIGHFLLTPEDLVPALALALYAGLRGVQTGRHTMFLLPLAWFVGGLTGLIAGRELPLPVAPALSLLLVGGLVAADVRLPGRAVSILVSVIGLVHGFFNGSALRGHGGVPGLAGITLMLFVLVTLAAALVVVLRKPWARIGVRVVGSWIGASGLLLLGWSLR